MFFCWAKVKKIVVCYKSCEYTYLPPYYILETCILTFLFYSRAWPLGVLMSASAINVNNKPTFKYKVCKFHSFQ